MCLSGRSCVDCFLQKQYMIKQLNCLTLNFTKMKNSILGLSGVTVLSNEEQKMIKGGGTCGYRVTMAAGEGVDGTTTLTVCGVGKSEAMAAMSLGSGHWCCDSCGSSSYCG